jgi:tetratricopeptide (TPR) repeat protein
MSAREVLQSWKEIASYLGRDVRTCRRWEENLGLPVHRLNGSPKARVLAYKDEIDWWLKTKLHEHDDEQSFPGAGNLPLPAGRPSFAWLRRWYALAGFTGLLVIGVLGWRSINGGRPRYVPNGSRPALAVLPFVNGTGDEALNYLRESVPDHLVRELQQSAERLTVFSFDAVAEAVRRIGLAPGVPLSADDMAAVSVRLGAGWLLIGSLSGAGTKLRVHYELREVQAIRPIKSDQVPGTEANIEIMEARVANGVRRAFGIPTSAAPEGLSACSLQATRLYESARAIQREYTLSLVPADLDKMIGLLELAREADPGCALVYIGLGDAFQHRFVYEDLDPEALRLMEENYRRAYEMAPERAEANVGLAWVHYFRRDNDQAYACLKKAISLDPGSLEVLTDVGAFLRSIGMLERAAEYFTRVLQAGGSTADIYLLRAWTYEQMGLYESALADFDRMIALEPTDFRARCHRARVLILMKRFDAAATELATAETLVPGAPYVGFVKALSAAAKGERKAALEAIAPERAGTRPARNTYYKSRVYAALGMKDEAIRTIELAIDKGFDDVHDYLYFFPFLNNTRDYFYDKLRGDPKFGEILRREERKYAENLEKYSGL